MSVRNHELLDRRNAEVRHEMQSNPQKCTYGSKVTISRLLVIATLLFSVGILNAFGQSDSSSISGTVTDPNNAVLAGVNVSVTNDATGLSHSVTTNNTGGYTVTNIAPGIYTVQVKATGFQTSVRKGVPVDPSIGSRQDFILQMGNANTTVVVQADVIALQTESDALGQLVTSEQVKSIQLNGRNPMYLSQLEPGVTRNASMTAFNFSPDFGGPVINGARAAEVMMTLDGASMVRTRANGTQIGVADADSLSQVQTLTTSYPAEYGGTSGGIIRMVPRSGTNTFHGAAYNYLRNSFFNANTWDRNQSNQSSLRNHPPAFRYNQFGWNLNGPAIIPHLFNQSRTKLFFEVGQEYLRYRQSTSQTGIAPTEAMRQGNFGELLQGNIFYSTPEQIINPATGAPYPGNVITSGLSPNGLALLNAFPVPNETNNSSYNWQAEGPYPQTQRKDTLVLDYMLAQQHHLRFSVLNYNYDNESPFAGNFNRTPEKWHWPNQVATLNYTWAINATTVNEAIFSASADHVTISYDMTNGLYDRTQYGINFPYLFPASEKLIPTKIPTINISNFTVLSGDPYPSHSGGVITNLGDNFTKVVVNHTLKFGFLWQRSGENDFDQINVSSTTPGATNNQNGQFVFTDTRSGHPTSNVAVANAALGLFDTYGEIGQKSYTLYRSNMYEFFAQDQWRVTPKLVAEFGMRYSIMQPYYALWGNQSFFDPSLYSASTAPRVDPTTGLLSGGNQYDGVVIPGNAFPSSAQGHVASEILSGTYNDLFHGYDRAYAKTVWSDIQPRFGVTFQIAPLTVIRAGGGRFVQRLGISDQIQPGGNPPFQPSSTVTAGSADNPGAAGTSAYPLQFATESRTLPSPSAWSWNVTAEQEVPGFATFTLTYVGRRGLHLQQLANINQLRPGTVQANPGIASPDALRPYQGYAAILEGSDAGSSLYNALQARLNRRLTKNVFFGIAYTWSKSMDYGSSIGYELPNAYDPRPNYGPSDFDLRNVLVVNYGWDIPFANHASSSLIRSTLGNWQLSGTTQAQTGEPFSVGTGIDYAGVGPASGTQLWDLTKRPVVQKKFGKGYWFDPTAFAAPPAGTIAPRGTRNAIYAPGFQSWNIAMQKSVHVIPEHSNHMINFKAEAFNFTNHPNLDTPDKNPTSGTFGEVSTKGSTYSSDRELQFSLRYEF